MLCPHPRFALRTIPLALFSAFAIFTTFAEADEIALKDTVVTATLSEHDTRTAPASATVITREELEKRNASDLLDAVRGTPGMTLSPRQVGGRKTLALRGLEGKHTLTLIDGRRISPSDDVVGHSDYQYSWLPVSAIERVEIIRGPMSTLYGSEALGGVINLITRQPKDKWIGSAMLSGSSLIDGDGGNGQQGSIFAAGPLGDRIALRVNVETTDRAAVPQKAAPQYSEIEGRKSRSGGLGGTLKLSETQSLDVQWSSGEEERNYNDVSNAGIAYENRYDIERSQASVAWKGEFGSWRSQVRAYQSEIDITNKRTNGVSITRPQNLSDQVVDGFAAIKLANQVLTFGGEHRIETLKNSGLIGGEDDAKHQALFVQDEITLSNNLILTAGVRGDKHEIFGFEASPRAYLVWEATPELIIKGGYGHAFKAPTLKQISPSYIGAEGPHTFLGNAETRPESADSFEISADWKRGPLNLRATAFHTKVDDLITYRLIKSVTVGKLTRRTYLYDNIDQATLNGLETGFTWAINPNLNWNTNLTFLHTKNEATGKELEDRPGITIASQLDWTIGHGWNARGAAEYYGTQTSAGEHLPAYALLNASIGKRLDKTFSLRAGINNLTDVRLADKSPNFGYAELGRNAFVTVRADF